VRFVASLGTAAGMSGSAGTGTVELHHSAELVLAEKPDGGGPASWVGAPLVPDNAIPRWNDGCKMRLLEILFEGSDAPCYPRPQVAGGDAVTTVFYGPN